mmetsp:Transcript_29740/g.78009  ORF Transcript_29740/g.78009 Transcript_29740/m.78009 type:complete len:108 (-) Transcript_29740:353-676(-)
MQKLAASCMKTWMMLLLLRRIWEATQVNVPVVPLLHQALTLETWRRDETRRQNASSCKFDANWKERMAMLASCLSPATSTRSFEKHVMIEIYAEYSQDGTHGSEGYG